MAATLAPNVHRDRRSTVLGRAAEFVRGRAPTVGAWAAYTGRRIRSAAMTIGGLTLVTAAAWEVDSALGKLTAGASLLVAEYLVAEDETSPR